jgi:hypothetical protein
VDGRGVRTAVVIGAANVPDFLSNCTAPNHSHTSRVDSLRVVPTPPQVGRRRAAEIRSRPMTFARRAAEQAAARGARSPREPEKLILLPARRPNKR